MANPSESSGLPQAWLAAALSDKFGAIRQIETVKQRPWSEVYRIVAERGTSYFKICGPDAQYEVALVEWLAPDYRDSLPEIMALSAEQGWLLMADAGIPLRDLLSPESHAPEFERLLTIYAQVQHYSLSHIDDLLAMQLPDRRLDQLSQLTQDLVETGRQQGWLDAALSNRVLDTLPTLERLCAALSASSYAAALDHGDLHRGNVLVKDNQLRICDWGDVCITHPFCSLLPLVETVMEKQFSSVGEIVNGDLIQAYLQTWRPFAPSHVLKIEMQQALCLGLVLRALDIAYMLQKADAESVKRWSPFVSKFLARWVHLAATIPQNGLE